MKKNNDVTSFFYYMWNSWCKAECELVFAGMSSHFWDKWVSAYQRNNGANGATETFFAELGENFQDALVKRATEVYDRRSKIV